MNGFVFLGKLQQDQVKVDAYEVGVFSSVNEIKGSDKIILLQLSEDCFG